MGLWGILEWYYTSPPPSAYIPCDKCKAVLYPQINKIMYFAGLFGMYCLKEQRPRLVNLKISKKCWKNSKILNHSKNFKNFEQFQKTRKILKFLKISKNFKTFEQFQKCWTISNILKILKNLKIYEKF